MKKILLAATALLLSTGAFAKKVKFSVDMTGQAIAANGLHIEGDFQTAAGYTGGDHNSGSTSLTQEGATNIWSVTVNIPAFKAYEFKYINGNQFYDAEFVPQESRVNTINDYRWIYVDSLGNDTMKLAAIQYGLNAPANLNLVRFRVDLRNALPAAATGAHVAGAFQGSNPATTRLYSFADSVYEYIAYVTAGTYAYKYYSGNTSATAETVPAACAANGNRNVAVTGDIVLNTVCFSSCSACVSTAVHGPTAAASSTAVIAPNPVQDYLLINFNDGAAAHDVSLTDMTGRTVRRIQQLSAPSLRIDRGSLPAGIYTLSISTDGQVANTKISLQ